MPITEVRVFKDDDGNVPIVDWLKNLKIHEPKVYKKCLARILMLAKMGNQMRRPYADSLHDGIHELRVTIRRIHYRMLYFFFKKNAATISHGIKKEAEVPEKEINLASERRNMVIKYPDKYTADFEV